MYRQHCIFTFCLSLSTSLLFPYVRRDWIVLGVHKILITMQARIFWDVTSCQNTKQEEAAMRAASNRILTQLDNKNHAGRINFHLIAGVTNGIFWSEHSRSDEHAKMENLSPSSIQFDLYE